MSGVLGIYLPLYRIDWFFGAISSTGLTQLVNMQSIFTRVSVDVMRFSTIRQGQE
jgi:hypothetical protein